MMPEFKSFKKIEPIGKLYMTITQKLHGTNAQIYIYPDENNELQIKAGNRTRWLSVDNDNFGFAKFVEDNKEVIIQSLGEGRHYGEWCGPGINSGEGLKEKGFYLFNIFWMGKPLPARVSTVPVLYTGAVSIDTVEDIMDHLKKDGSALVPGYMKPEGIVIQIADKLYKKVFKEEESKWKGGYHPLKNVQGIDVSGLLQPIRLEKLLSRDSKYREEYPKTLPLICADYVKDLEEENQIIGTEDEKKAIKKALGQHIFKFVKSEIYNV